MSEHTEHSAELIQVYSIYIDAPASEVWKAITTSEYTERWGYGGAIDFEPRVGGRFDARTTQEMRDHMGMGEFAVRSEILEIDEPRLLKITWNPTWYDDMEQTVVTWELLEYPSGLTRVTLTHDCTAAPKLASEVAGGGDPDQGGGGWLWSLAGLKTLLETGREMGAAAS